MRPDLLPLLRCPATGADLDLDVLEGDGDDVTAGVLRAGTEEYPVLWGVPVLLSGYGESVRLLREGRPGEAAAAALLQQLAPSRLARVAAAVGAVPGGSRPGTALARADLRRLRAALVPLLDDPTDPLALVRLGFDTWSARTPEAVNYFTYRFGTPRHLVALAAAASAEVGDGPVLDLGCGAGHLTWGLQQRFGADRVVGVDLSLFEVWAARGVADPGRLVCGDATALPLASGRFGLVMASDVFSFVHHKWAAAREARRVLAPGGTLAIAAVKNSLRPHVYAGMPLSPAGWRRLAGDLPHRLYADDRVLDRYFAGQAMAGDDAGDADQAPTVTLLAGAGAEGRTGPLGDWPHAGGPLGVNPLLHRAEDRDGEVVFRRRFPSEGFADDNPPLRRYLPEEVTLPRAALDGDQLDRARVEHLVPTTAVLALPAVYRRAPASAPARPVAVAP